MLSKAYTLGLFVLFCIWIDGIYAGDDDDVNTCTYSSLCTRTTTTDGNTIEKTYKCKKREACTISYGPWSDCSKGDNKGFRKRYGNCVGANCNEFFRESERCGDSDGEATWSTWSTWATGSCSASCCGGTGTRIRSRSCSGKGCKGDSTEKETGVACNTQECPLSCVGVSVGTIFNDPCVRCSNSFRACNGDPTPLTLNCPDGKVWSPAKNNCEGECD